MKKLNQQQAIEKENNEIKMMEMEKQIREMSKQLKEKEEIISKNKISTS